MTVFPCMMMMMMMMNAHILGWFLFLALVKHSTGFVTPIELEDDTVTATEGSCVEFKCKVAYSVPASESAYWFWMKDPQWEEAMKTFSAAIVYSTNNAAEPVSPEFAGRVQYVGSPPSQWSKAHDLTQKPTCNILICNLNKTDSGKYMFRYIGEQKWSSKETINLTVTDNLCPITFEKPPVMRENDTMTLTCSTFSSCPSPNITVGPVGSQVQSGHNQTHKSTSVSFTAAWQDDGRVFTCQHQDKKDKYLMTNISITVEYAPKEISNKKSSEEIKEGDSVTLTCSAKGNPTPTFTWFRDRDNRVSSAAAEWKVPSITEQDSGQYYCRAINKYGNATSSSVTIDVNFPPKVEINVRSSVTVRQGDTVNLSCNVKRSKPEPDAYAWFKDGKPISSESTQTMYIRRMTPEDRGYYTCKATNRVGTGTSEKIQINVHYAPRKTTIDTSESKVKVGRSLTLICSTDANPAPHTYSWYHSNSSQQTDLLFWSSTSSRTMTVTNVQRAHGGCYACNASNSIGAGPITDAKCITVLYPPTVPELSMATEATENQTITISCSAEGSPAPTLTLTSKRKLSVSAPRRLWPIQTFNHLDYTFSVTLDDNGTYTCEASNSEGSNQSRKTLVVRYAPKDVTITGPLEVDENELLTLSCAAKSYPKEKSFSWTRDGKKVVSRSSNSQTFIVLSVSPSDSGSYSCAASNDVGTRQSRAVEVKVKYAPKHTEIQSTEQQHRDGTRSVTLRCSAQSYPPVSEYYWFRKEKGKEQKVRQGPTYTVHENQPGTYYCFAKYVRGGKRSDEIHLFGSTFPLVRLLLCLFLTLIMVVIFFLVYRHRKKNSTQRGGARCCFGFMGWPSGARTGAAIHGTFLAQPSRSRDDLLSDRSHRPEAPNWRPAPDSTPASDVSTVYSAVKLQPQKQAAGAQKAAALQGGHTAAASPTYASLQFGNKTNNKQIQVANDDVYAKVCKSTPHKQNKNEWLTDYENVSATVAAKAPSSADEDTDSDDEVQLNYAQVNFTANPGHQRASSDSSSSDDYETQYSDVKI